ncbi:MAG TPA: hypothetical protein VGR78_00395 [Verrucomicrobiae bacterium]|nr:hypothetical protein [Verrucomicrobiae bacterium]
MRQTKKAAARILRIAVYPGLLWKGDKKLWLNPTIPVTIDTPPTFLLEAENDPVDEVYHALAYYMALKEAKVPAELHLYAEGGYGGKTLLSEQALGLIEDAALIALESK